MNKKLCRLKLSLINVLKKSVLQVLEILEDIAEKLGLKYSQLPRYKGVIQYEGEVE